jgi:hypothetical protein
MAAIQETYQRMVLATRPRGPVVPDNFRLETLPVPDLADGQVLVRNHYLSLDPYMRGRMSAAQSYAASQALDQTMIGGTVGQVLASRNAHYQAGEFVGGMLGWSEMGVSDGVLLRKLDTARIPLSAFLGVVGMPGMAAWYGFHQIMQAAMPSWCRRPAARSAAWSANWRACTAAARSASPAGLKNAVMSSRTSVSTPASITRPAIWRPIWLPPRRTALTPSLKTSAAPAWMRPWRAAMPLPGSRCAA